MLGSKSSSTLPNSTSPNLFVTVLNASATVENVPVKSPCSRAREMSSKIGINCSNATLVDISRAREHGDLTGTFSTVADALSTVTKRLGLVEFGKVDEDFDPSIHEALSTMEDDSVQSQKVGTVAQVGYKVGERILRPARVVVKQPPAK